MNKPTYALTHAQRRVWYMEELYPGTSVSNIYGLFKVNSRLDTDILQTAFNRLLARNDALRIRLTANGGLEPVQSIVPYEPADLDILDFRSLDEAQLRDRIEEMARAPFKLFDSPLYEFKMIIHKETWLCLKCHHIAMDGISMNLIGNELLRLYVQCLNGESAETDEIHTYSAYINGEQDYEASPRFGKDRDYWLEQYGTLPDFSGLKPSDTHRFSPAAERRVWLVPERLQQKIRSFADENRVSVYAIFLTGLYLILHKMTGNLDLAVGAFYANRTNKTEKEMPGMFVSTLPLRVRIEPEEAGSALVRKVSREQTAVLRHQKYPYNALLEELRTVHKNLDALFRVTMDYQPLQWKRMGGIEYRDEQIFCGSEFHELGFHLKERIETGELILQADYRKELFRETELEELKERLFYLIGQLIERPELPVQAFGLLPESELRREHDLFNNTRAEYPADKMLHELFEERTARTPERTAVRAGNRTWTYGDLNERANRLARGLRSRGVEEGTVIAVMAERSFDMLAAIFGILKAGAAYLPIDPNYPEERIQYLLADSSAAMLLTQEHLPCPDGIRERAYRLEDEGLYDADGSDPERAGDARSLAYIMYTSGSTGLPKGVMIEHASVVNVLTALQKKFPVEPGDRYLLKTTFTFDISVPELFGWFLGGGELALLPPDMEKDPREVAACIRKHGITHANFVPSVMRLTLGLLTEDELQSFRSLKYLFFGGEAVSSDLVRTFHRLVPGVRLENCYGPTEATVYATTFPLPPDLNAAHVPIGKPLDNYEAMVVDRRLQLQPVGVAGELCLAGAGIARGYLNRPELNAEKFAPHPFREGERMYRTGDLVRRLPDGGIEYLGRMDYQVKIRGFRIELGEIEAALLKSGWIQEAVVVPREDADGETYLCAYYTVSGTGEHGTPREIRALLNGSLPRYMVPTRYRLMEAMPLTANGKLDRNALPEPQDGPYSEYAEPRSEAEAALAKAWREVLALESVGIWDHFFELGGDSIKAMQVVSRLRARHWKMETKQLFRLPVLADAAQTMRTLAKSAAETPVEGPVLPTPIQRWFAEQRFAEAHHWNQAVVLHSKEGFDESAVRQAWAALVRHHDGLRTVFEPKGQGFAGLIRRADAEEAELFAFALFDLRHERTADSIIENKLEELQGSFDLRRGPLVNIALFRTAKGDYLSIVIHHLVVDGVSWTILLDDFALSYEAAASGTEPSLPEKTMSYQEWAVRLNQYAEETGLRSEADFRERLEREIPEELPKDGAAGNGLMKDGLAVTVKFSELETARIMKEAHRAYGADVQDVLLTALASAVSEWTGGSRVFLGLEGHGRDGAPGSEADVSRTVGWFTSLYPVVLELNLQDTPGRRLVQVKERLRGIPRKGVGYGLLNDRVPREEGKPANRRKPEICFNYLGDIPRHYGRDWSLAFLPPSSSFGPGNARAHALDIVGMRMGGELSLRFEFHPGQFREATIRSLSDSFERNLRLLLDWCSGQSRPERTPSEYGGSLSPASLQALRERVGMRHPGAEIEAVYALSPMQEGMLFHSLADGRSAAYHQQLRFSMQGRADKPALMASFKALAARHDILRTVIWREGASQPLQVVLAGTDLGVEFVDGTLASRDGEQAFTRRWLTRDRERGFELDGGPLFRMRVIELGEERYEIVWSYHHLLLDGWSLPVLFRDFAALYREARGLSAPTLPPAPPYRRFIEWLERQDREEALAYWRARMDGFEQLTGLPSGSRAGQDGAYRKRSARREIPEGTVRRLKELAARNRSTLHVITECAWAILLGRYNLTRDVVFGKVVSGRSPDIIGSETMVGLLVNTVPARISWEEGTLFSELLRTVQEQELASAAYEFCPLAEVRQRSALPQNLFDHIMVFENYPLSHAAIGGEPDEGELAPLSADLEEQTSYDLNLFAVPGRTLQVNFSYNAEVYDPAVIDRAADHLVRLLEQIAEGNEIGVGELELLSEEERRQIVDVFNDTKTEEPSGEAVLHRLFERAAQEAPSRTALEGTGSRITYGELNERANRLAHGLRRRGIGEGAVVGVMAERSPELIVALLGILKAGAAYMPLHPDDPSGRLRHALRDSGAALVLTQPHLAERTAGLDVRADSLEDPELYAEDSSNPETAADGGSMAYLIYTSGSTGTPKGVMIGHAGVVNVLRALQESYPLTGSDGFLLKTTYTFDVSVAELFGWFRDGGRLVLLPPGEEREPGAIAEAIRKYGVTHVNFVPSMLRAFLGALGDEELQGLRGLKHVFAAGEAISADLARMFHEKLPGVRLVNAYGPTEATVYATACSLPPGLEAANMPIGRPLRNMRAYVTDGQGRLQPVGIAGELCLAGPGLAQGYLNLPEETAEKFVPNPFRPGERMYRTGDLARWLPDGSLEYMGRMDHQVKIRGYRIEPAEIEQALMKLGGVREAVVLAREEQAGGRALCAYVVADERWSATAARTALAGMLPRYMVPAYFFKVESMPQTASGKLDRKALPSPEENGRSGVPYEAPRNEIEAMMCETWQELLGIGRVGIRDGYFDLGGDSIKALQIASRLRDYGLELKVKEMFKYTTIAELSAFVERMPTAAWQGAEEGEVELTAVQRWFFGQPLEARHHFNQSVSLHRPGGFDETALRAVLRRLAEHHDALRLVFAEESGTWKQRNRGVDGLSDEELFALEITDLTGDAKAEQRRAETEARVQAGMDLAKGPLLRACLFRMDDGDRLTLAIHHLAVDGISWRILLEDFRESYAQAAERRDIRLRPKSVPYREYARQITEYARSGAFAAELDYWRSVEQAPAAALPQDADGPNGRRADASRIAFGLSEAETEQLLTRVNRAYNTEINDILLTALGMTVTEWTKSPLARIALEGHGRENVPEGIDLTRTVGWFTSIYPVLLDLSADAGSGEPAGGDARIQHAVKRVKDTLRRVPHKGMGYGYLRYLPTAAEPNGLGGGEAPDLCFNYLGRFEEEERQRDVRVSFLDTADSMVAGSNSRPYKLEINGMVAGGRLTLYLDYFEGQFRHETARRFADGLLANLRRVAAHCLAKEETEHTVTDFHDRHLSENELESILDIVGELTL